MSQLEELNFFLFFCFGSKYIDQIKPFSSTLICICLLYPWWATFKVLSPQFIYTWALCMANRLTFTLFFLLLQLAEKRTTSGFNTIVPVLAFLWMCELQIGKVLFVYFRCELLNLNLCSLSLSTRHKAYIYYIYTYMLYPFRAYILLILLLW